MGASKEKSSELMNRVGDESQVDSGSASHDVVIFARARARGAG